MAPDIYTIFSIILPRPTPLHQLDPKGYILKRNRCAINKSYKEDGSEFAI